MNNPFKTNTTSHYDWEVLKDLRWHCTKCELKSAHKYINKGVSSKANLAIITTNNNMLRDANGANARFSWHDKPV